MQKTWQNWLKQHDQLAKKSAGLVWERMQLLLKVEQDRGFKQWCEQENKSWVGVLNEKLSDTCATYGELCLVLRKYPDKQQWEEGSLWAKKLEVLQPARRVQTGGEGNTEITTTEKLSWKQKYLELRAKFDTLNEQYGTLRKDYKELVKSLRQGQPV